MAGVKGKSGGARPGAGRPPTPGGPKQYIRLSVEIPGIDDTQGCAAIEWWRSLTPEERLDRIAADFDLVGDTIGNKDIWEAWFDEANPDFDSARHVSSGQEE